MTIEAVSGIYLSLGAGGLALVTLTYLLLYKEKQTDKQLEHLNSNYQIHEEILRNNNEVIKEVAKSNQNVASALTLLDTNMSHLISQIDLNNKKVENVENLAIKIRENVRKCNPLDDRRKANG